MCGSLLAPDIATAFYCGVVAVRRLVIVFGAARRLTLLSCKLSTLPAAPVWHRCPVVREAHSPWQGGRLGRDGYRQAACRSCGLGAVAGRL